MSGPDALAVALHVITTWPGARVFPVVGKQPAFRELGRDADGVPIPWDKAATRDPDQVAAWFIGTNYGVGVTGILAIDSDAADEGALARATFGPVLDRAVVICGNPAHRTFVYAQPAVPLGDGKWAGGEIKGSGYIVLPPSRHVSDKCEACAAGEHCYQWLSPDGLATPLVVWDGEPPGTSGPQGEALLANPEVAAQWQSWLTAGEPCPAMQRVLDTFRDGIVRPGASRHEVMNPAQFSVLRLGEQGHRGGEAGLDYVRRGFMWAVGEDRERSRAAASEWKRGLRGAVEKISADPTDWLDKGCCAGQEPVSGAIEAEGLPEAMPGASWADVPIGELVGLVVTGDYEPPVPSMVTFGDGRGLLYPGRVHGVHGIGGAGKTWLAAVALASEIEQRHHVVFVDLEDTAATMIERLVRDLQVDPALVVEYLHYKAPTEGTAFGTPVLIDTVVSNAATLVVLDSVGEGLSMENAKQNEDDEVARWMRRVARSVAAAGATVLLIDHVPKSDDATMMPIGSQRKQAAMNGVVYSAQVVEPFSRDHAGSVKIVCGKDRLGGWKRGEVVAVMHIRPRDDGEGSAVTLEVPEEEQQSSDYFRPTYLMEQVSVFIEGNPGCSKNSIRKAVKGKNAAIDQAVRTLIMEGYVGTAQGARGAVLHRSARAYREPMSRRSLTVPPEGDE
jgi:hypothetical protein